MYINKRFITGNLGDAPKVYPNETKGTVMLLFSTAQTRRFRKGDGTYGEITEWTDHKWFLKKEEYARVESKLVKGAFVYIEGRHDQVKRVVNDAERTFHEIFVLELQFLPKPRQQSGDDANSDDENRGQSDQPAMSGVNGDNFKPSQW